MRERLRIGEVARLVGVTPKTVRHYEKLGLLPEAARSESGYRLYSANDLLHLNRVKRLRSLGLTLRQVRAVLGAGNRDLSLRTTLEALRTQVDSEMARLEERRRLIDETLSREDLEASETSPSFERAMELLGGRLSGVSESALEQDKKLWSYFEKYPPREDLAGSSWSSQDPIGHTLAELTLSAFSPAQQRVMALLVERAEAEERGAPGG